MRELLMRVFRCPVFDVYGSREVAGMAYECDHHEGLHVPLQTVHIEVVGEDGRAVPHGELGRIIVTSLTNYAMPLIRYEIGDLGILADHQCTCGRVWPLLQQIVGRISDTFVKADGTLVAGQYFNYVFFLQDWVDRFQIIQDSQSKITARIVERADANMSEASKAAAIEEMEGKVRLVMGDDCKVEFVFEDYIEPSSSGKYRFAVSHLHEETAARSDIGEPSTSANKAGPE